MLIRKNTVSFKEIWWSEKRKSWSNRFTVFVDREMVEGVTRMYGEGGRERGEGGRERGRGRRGRGGERGEGKERGREGGNGEKKRKREGKEKK
jgi:hypothetical protein